jgi:hypothetical protein
LGLTVSTGHGAKRCTFSATEPSNSLLTPLREVRADDDQIGFDVAGELHDLAMRLTGPNVGESAQRKFLDGRGAQDIELVARFFDGLLVFVDRARPISEPGERCMFQHVDKMQVRRTGDAGQVERDRHRLLRSLGEIDTNDHHRPAFEFVIQLLHRTSSALGAPSCELHIDQSAL